MIDVIINSAGGLTLAHDERVLDGYDDLEVSSSTGAATLVGAEGRRPIGTLAPSMLSCLRGDMKSRSIRMSGWSLARIAPLAVNIVN